MFELHVLREHSVSISMGVMVTGVMWYAPCKCYVSVSLSPSGSSPRLGGSLKWVVLFGGAFFLATSVDGLTRAFHYVRLPFR